MKVHARRQQCKARPRLPRAKRLDIWTRRASPIQAIACARRNRHDRSTPQRASHPAAPSNTPPRCASHRAWRKRAIREATQAARPRIAADLNPMLQCHNAACRPTIRHSRYNTHRCRRDRNITRQLCNPVRNTTRLHSRGRNTTRRRRNRDRNIAHRRCSISRRRSARKKTRKKTKNKTAAVGDRTQVRPSSARHVRALRFLALKFRYAHGCD